MSEYEDPCNDHFEGLIAGAEFWCVLPHGHEDAHQAPGGNPTWWIADGDDEPTERWTPAQPVAPAPDAAVVLAGLVADLRALWEKYVRRSGMEDYAAGLRVALAVAERHATSGARAAGGIGPYPQPHEFGEWPEGVDEAELAQTVAEAEQALERGEVSTLDEVVPPTPSAPGVAALLAECARRLEYLRSYREPTFSCREIQRYLAPEGADGEGKGT